MTKPDATEGSRRGGVGGRRKAREFALQGLYAWLVAAQEPDAILADLRESEDFGTAEAAYVEELVRCTIAAAPALRESLATCLDRATQELSPVEHAILLIGAYELAHRPEIPHRVVINEAIELAKSYGGTDGYKYVNGVLDRLAGTLRSVERGGEP